MSYKILPHLDHVNQLEVASYRKNQDENEPLDSVTVECTKCGEVVEEVYNASEDNTSSPDALRCGQEANEAVERDACRVSGVMQERKRWQEGLEALEVAAEEADELGGVARGDGIRHAIEFMRGVGVCPRKASIP